MTEMDDPQPDPIRLLKVRDRIVITDLDGHYIHLDLMANIAIAPQGIVLVSYLAEGIRGAISLPAWSYDARVRRHIITDVQRRYRQEQIDWQREINHVIVTMPVK